VASARSVTLHIILPTSTSNLIFINALHIPTLGADLVSLGILHHKSASIHSWKPGLIVSKNSEDLFSATFGSSCKGML